MQVSVVKPSWLEGQARLEAGAAVAHHLHGAVLLDPELAHDHVVDAAVHVCPGVGFPPPGRIRVLVTYESTYGNMQEKLS